MLSKYYAPASKRGIKPQTEVKENQKKKSRISQQKGNITETVCKKQ